MGLYDIARSIDRVATAITKLANAQEEVSSSLEKIALVQEEQAKYQDEFRNPVKPVNLNKEKA